MDINLTAPVNQLGYGVVGLNVALALDRGGHAPALWFLGGIDAPPEHHAALVRMRDRTASYNPSAPSLRVWHQFDLAQHVGRGPHCAMPIFELDRFKPVELHHLRSQDVVFANSKWAARVLADNGVAEASIRPAPLGVDGSIFRPDAYDPKPALDRTLTGGPTVFLNCGKWEYRKGHDVLLEAFNKAFEPSDNVKLVMNCHNPCRSAASTTDEDVRRYNDEWVRAYKTSKMGDRVDVRPTRLPTQRDVASLMSLADCGVFPSRAEGWGLESAEMLAMGKHVILTDFSAHTEYATAANSLLIGVDDLEVAYDGHWFLADDRTWAGGEPGRWAHMGPAQVDQLVAHLRHVHHLKQSRRLGPNLAGVETMAALTWDRTAADITSALS